MLVRVKLGKFWKLMAMLVGSWLVHRFFLEGALADILKVHALIFHGILATKVFVWGLL